MHKHLHAGFGAALFVTAVVILLHFSAIAWQTKAPESPLADAWATLVG